MIERISADIKALQTDSMRSEERDLRSSFQIPGWQERTEELLAYAREQGLNFLLPSAEDIKMVTTFLKSHPLVVSGNQWRRHRLEDIQVLLEEEFVKIDTWMQEIESGNLHTEILRSLRHATLLKDRLEDLIELAKKVIHSEGEDSTSELHPQFQSACASLKRFLRYMLDSYHGGRLGVEFVAEIIGFANVEELLWQRNGTRRVIIDFGCGDGDLLIELARAVRRRERGREFLEEYIKLLKSHGVKIKEISNQALKSLNKELTNFLGIEKLYIEHILEPLDPYLIGLDEAALTLEELSITHGISTRVADICDTDFFTHTDLTPARADVAISILTLDRVADLDQFLQNFSDSLKLGGRFLLANKGIIDTRSDSDGVTILYRHENDLKDETYSGTLQKLRVKLAQFGLIVESISLHPYAVISTEGIQYYNLVVVGGKKLAAHKHMNK